MFTNTYYLTSFSQHKYHLNYLSRIIKRLTQTIQWPTGKKGERKKSQNETNKNDTFWKEKGTGRGIALGSQWPDCRKINAAVHGEKNLSTWVPETAASATPSTEAPSLPPCNQSMALTGQHTVCQQLFGTSKLSAFENTFQSGFREAWSWPKYAQHLPRAHDNSLWIKLHSCHQSNLGGKR